MKRRAPDAAFEAEKLAVEVNGRQYRNSADALTEDTLRAGWFASAGWLQFPVRVRCTITGWRRFSGVFLPVQGPQPVIVSVDAWRRRSTITTRPTTSHTAATSRARREARASTIRMMTPPITGMTT